MSVGKLLYSRSHPSFQKREGVEYSDEDCFFIVWGESSRRATIKQSHYVAMKEAERLSKHHKGERFYVMKALYEFVEGVANSPPRERGIQGFIRGITLETEMSVTEMLKIPPSLLAQLSEEVREVISTVQLSAALKDQRSE